MNAFELEIGLCVQHPVIDQVVVGNGLFVAVVVAGGAVAAVELGKGVVVDVVGGRGGKAELDGVEVVEQGFVALVDGAVAFIRDDEVVVADGQALIDLHHAGVGGELDAGAGGIAAFDAGEAFVGQVGLELAHGLAHQLAPVGQEQHALNALGA